MDGPGVVNGQQQADWEPLLEQLRGRPIQIAMVCTGGGAGAISRCFRRSGASTNFVEAIIPYSRAASAEYLGKPAPPSRASRQFAEQLAEVARTRAARLSDRAPELAVGLALVAALPTSDDRGVEQRIHVAINRTTHRQTWSEHWPAGEHNRQSAEDLADAMVFRAIASLLAP